MSRPRSTTEEERIEGLAECLADALDMAGLYVMETDRDFKAAAKVLTRMLTGLVIFSWKPERGTMRVAGVEPWIVSAMERAMIARGPRDSDLWICLTVVN